MKKRSAIMKTVSPVRTLAATINITTTEKALFNNDILEKAISLQNKKITVVGVINNIVGSYTIMGQVLTETQSIPDPTKWKKTNISGKPVSPGIACSDEVTQLDGVDLPELQVIAFVVIVTGFLQPVISSNVVTAVTIAYLNKALGFYAPKPSTTQINGVNIVKYTPIFVDTANGSTETTVLKPSGLYRYVYNFISAKSGALADSFRNNGGVTTVPASYFIVKSPLQDDQYTLSCSFSAPITVFLSKNIGPDSELSITSDSFTQGKVVNLGTVSTTVKW